MKILNITQHKATIEQKEKGIVDMPEELSKKIIPLLNFNEIPNEKDIKNAVYNIQKALYEYVGLNFGNTEHTDDLFKEKSGFDGFMIGGAPFLMPHLANELSYMGNVYYAFSKRVSIEEVQPDGSVAKKSIFKFEGLVPHIGYKKNIFKFEGLAPHIG